ncbi:MAG: ShlB/FhaC/HecB family hemolysin secretion/activation protein [Chlorobium sp.]|nr:MAG: ShlB/FhaC/HecB family hemolysin secretion/activation protein [Chlorobium sp.]
MFPKIITLIVAAALLWGGSLKADPVPDAGSILQQQQQQQAAQVQELMKPETQEAQVQELLKPDESSQQSLPADLVVKVFVKGFKFVGFEGMATDSELQPLVSGSIGKNLTFGDLDEIAGNITAYLKSQGWLLASVYLPTQDATSGIIEVHINQGKSDGNLSIMRDNSVRICNKVLRRIAVKSYRNGYPLNERRLERSVLLMNDLPGISAQATLAPGTISGSSELKYFVKEGPLLSGVAWVDNHGNRYTGSIVGGANLLVNDPFRRGEQVSLTLNRSEGLLQGGIEYTSPFCPNPGLTGTLKFSGMHYKLLEEFSNLGYEGNSYNFGAGLSYKVIRSRKINLTTEAEYGYKNLTDKSFDINLRDRSINSMTLGIKGDYQDVFLRGGYTTLSTGVTFGNLHEAIKDRRLNNAEGGYTRINLRVSRLQRFYDRLSMDLSLTSQTAFKNLDSSEKFFLGGPNSVRAYPLGEGSGDEGSLIKADLLYKIPTPAKWGELKAGVFFDAGHITLNKERYSGDVYTATNRNDYWLQGAGIEIRYDISRKFVIQGSWAQVIGDNPGRSVFGNNSDGRNDKSRVWLQGMMFF